MSAVPVTPPKIGANERLGATLALSLIVHGLLVLGVGFAQDDAAPVMPTLDVILSQTSTPQTPQELQAHACLSYSYWAAGNNWPLQGPGGEVKVSVSSLLHANNGDVLREAAIAGMGVILQPDFLLEDALADGRLVRVLPEWEAAPIGIFAVYTSRSHLAPKVRSFIDHLVETGV